MKISSDYAINFSSLNNLNKKSSNINAQKTINQIRPLPNGQKIRELSSAMLMIQKARYIIQQALTVSRQINNLATTTIQTGKVDSNQFSQELAQVNASLGEYGMEVISTNLPESKMKIVTKDEFSEIKNEVMQIEKQIKSKEFNYDKIDQSIGILKKLDKNFIKKQDIVFEEFDKIEKRKNNVNLLLKTIPFQPAKALTAQGNINSEKVSSLLM